jgi:hypothetical protein
MKKLEQVEMWIIASVILVSASYSSISPLGVVMVCRLFWLAYGK